MTAWWGRSGLMDTVRATGETEFGLSTPGMGDHPTAVAMYAAIVTALYRRQTTGQGGVVSTSLLANGLWSNACQVQAALCGHELPPRGPRGARSPLAEVYRTADGRSFILAIANPASQWPALARMLGKAEWLDDPRFSTPAAWMDNVAALGSMLEAAFASEAWETWRRRLTEAGVTFGIVAQTGDHADDPQIAANGMLPQFSDGEGLRTVDSPFHLAGEAKQAPRMAPAIGQHTRAILEECGGAADEIEALVGDG